MIQVVQLFTAPQVYGCCFPLWLSLGTTVRGHSNRQRVSIHFYSVLQNTITFVL